MSRFRVVVVLRAQRDIDSIVTWLMTRSPMGTQRWLAALEAAKEKLRDDPMRYPRVSERLRTSYEVRDILFKTPRGRIYRAIFTVANDVVRVLRIRRPAQRPLRGRDLRKS